MGDVSTQAPIASAWLPEARSGELHQAGLRRIIRPTWSVKGNLASR